MFFRNGLNTDSAKQVAYPCTSLFPFNEVIYECNVEMSDYVFHHCPMLPVLRSVSTTRKCCTR